MFFLLFYITWLSLYSKNKVLNICVATGLTLITLLIWHLIAKHKYKKQNIKQSEKKQIDKTAENLRCMETSKQKAFIKKIYKQKENEIIYVNLNEKVLTENEFYLIMQYAKKNKKNNVKVFCIDADTNLTLKFNEQETVAVEFFDKLDIYKLCKESNTFPPEIVKQKNKTKLTFKILLSNLLNKKRAKQYFAFSAFLLVFSIFTFFKTYYIISSTVFLILAIISLFENKIKGKKINQQV